MKKPTKNRRMDVLRVLKGLGMAILCLLLVWGLREQLHDAIDKCLVPIFGFKGNDALSLFFAVVTTTLAVIGVERFVVKSKVVSMRDAFLLLLAVGIYGIFRCVDGYYSFEGYWGGRFAYSDGFAIEGLFLLILFICQRIRLLSNDSSEEQAERFSTDLPISTYDEDLFNLKGIVSRIVRYIMQTDVSGHSFSIGVVGSWGEGKSSLMNLIRNELKGKNGYLLMDFHPRSSKDLDHIQEDFLESLRRVLAPNHSGMRRTIAQYAATINVADGTPALVKWLLRIIRIGASKDVAVTRQELQNAISDTGQNIVVFVDDMDRLTAKEILEVLKVVDRNGSFAGIYFLTAYDKNYVNEALAKELGATGAGNYSDKYFSVEIRLPAHPEYRLIDLLQDLLNEAVSKGVLPKLTTHDIDVVLKKHSRPILRRLRTVRDVKRFVNQLVYAYAGVQEDVVFGDYLLWELIKFSHPNEYVSLHRYEYVQSGVLTDASNELWYLSDSLVPRKEGGIVTPPDNAPQCWDVLTQLFPEPKSYTTWYNDRGKRIYSKAAFEFYFFNYEYAHLTQGQLLHLYEVSLQDGCETIDNWSQEEKRDLTTFLLTQDLAVVGEKERIQRYLQLLAFAYDRVGNINYWGRLFDFVRKEDVKEIMQRLSIKDKTGYLLWLKESFMPFLDIEPRVASTYLQQTISSVIDDPLNKGVMYMRLSDFQDIASDIAIEYLARIDNPGWDSFAAIYMSQVPKDKETLIQSASTALRESMRDHLERYTNKLTIITNTADGRGVATIHPSFQLAKVFNEPYEFGKFIFAKKNDNAPEIDLLRGLWPLFASNGFEQVVFNVDTDMDAVRKTIFAEYLGYLADIKGVGREIIDVDHKWNNGLNYLQADSLIDYLKQLDARLEEIQFNIKLKNYYQNRIQGLIALIEDQRESVLLLRSNDIDAGDFVAVSEGTPSLDRPQRYPAHEVFTVEAILSETHVKLKEVTEPFPISDLRAIPIDAETKDVIYFDPVALPLSGKSSADYTPFIKRFHSCKDKKGVSYNVLIHKLGLRFVHEVQHWLRTTFKQDLKVKHQVSTTFQP